jgi:hypothetical protein
MGNHREQGKQRRGRGLQSSSRQALAAEEVRTNLKSRRLPESNKYVFLNIPYDIKFRRMFLAYICGLTHMGLIPRATLEIQGGRNRSDKILELMRSCKYSIHDLSRVQLDRSRPATPRFNMPFELGLAFAVSKLDPNFNEDTNPHVWFVFETINRRVSKSLSDLSGADPNIHDGTVEGVMRELANSFSRPTKSGRPSAKEMMRTYRKVSGLVDAIQKNTKSKSLYETAIFRQLYFAAAEAAGLSPTP